MTVQRAPTAQVKAGDRAGAQPQADAVREIAADASPSLDLPFGPSGGTEGGLVKAQAQRLGDTRLRSAQRHALAARIGRLQGNRHLQRVVDFLRPVEAGVDSRALVQRQVLIGPDRHRMTGEERSDALSALAMDVNREIRDAIADHPALASRVLDEMVAAPEPLAYRSVYELRAEIARRILRRTRAPGRRGINWRVARAGETYHALKGAWVDRARAEQYEHELRPRGYVGRQIADVMRRPEIVRLEGRFGSMEVVVHRVRRVCEVGQGGNPMEGDAQGETLRPRDSGRVPPNEIHIAVADSGMGRLREVLSHELFHALMAVPQPARGSRRRGGVPHARDVVDALSYPQQSALVRRLGWPSGWDHPYRFGWFEHPVSGFWRHLDNPGLYQPLGWRRGGGGSWRQVSPENDEFLEGWASADPRPGVRSTCAQLLEVRRQRRYESGFRIQDNPEEDAATSFQRYLTEPDQLRSSHPKRYQLFAAYLGGSR